VALVSSTNWLYLRSEEQLWTVGFYDGNGKWQPETDHGSAEEAARRVIVLNGGTPEVMDEAATRAADPTYVPATRGLYAVWMHGCGALDEWPTGDSCITEQGCDACEGAPDGTWRQLYVEVHGE